MSFYFCEINSYAAHRCSSWSIEPSLQGSHIECTLDRVVKVIRDRFCISFR